jgi:hypothetical protein
LRGVLHASPTQALGAEPDRRRCESKIRHFSWPAPEARRP